MTTVEIAAPNRRREFVRARVGGLPRTFWVLWSGLLVNKLGTMVVPFLSLYLTGERGLSIGATGIVLAVLGGGSLASQAIGGVLTDRIGRRATLTFAMAASGGSMIVLGYASGLPMIVAAVLLFGLTSDLFRPAVSAMVADLIPPADRPRAYGLMFWAVNLGFAVATPLGGALARSGYIWLFWIDAITCGLFALLVWRAVPETGAVKSSKDRESGGFADVLRDRVMVVCVLAMLVWAFCIMQAFSTLPLAMKGDGLAPSAYGLAMAANGIVIITVQPLVAPWLQRFDHSNVITAGFVLVGIGVGFTSLASTTLTYTAAVVGWTLGEIVVSAVGQAIVADLSPVHLRGRYAGMWGMAFSAGLLIAPLGGTRLLQISSPTLWLTCTALCLGGAVATFSIGPAVRRRRAALA